jgi:DNA invertase Pin-like site-specific DNA recombinase
MATQPDRLVRDPCDLWMVASKLQEKGAFLLVIDAGGEVIDASTMVGKLLLNGFAMVGILESQVKSSRTKAAWRTRRERAKGRAMGPKWGYRKIRGTSFYEPDPDMIYWARKAFKMHKAGASNKTIRETLEKEYCENAGKPFKNSEWHNWFFKRWHVRNLLDMYQDWLDIQDRRK